MGTSPSGQVYSFLDLVFVGTYQILIKLMNENFRYFLNGQIMMVCVNDRFLPEREIDTLLQYVPRSNNYIFVKKFHALPKINSQQLTHTKRKNFTLNYTMLQTVVYAERFSFVLFC